MSSFLVMEDGTERSVESAPDDIECFRCGVCCVRYRPRVSGEEIARISRELGLSVTEFKVRYVRTMSGSGDEVLDGEGDRCPFLSWDPAAGRAGCRIHSVRPEACRRWAASLSKPECKEGLALVGRSTRLLLPGQLYDRSTALHTLCSALSPGGDEP